MEIIFVSLVIVGGFGYVSYLHSKHVQKLEVLIKAQDLAEVKKYEEPIVKIEYVEDQYKPESLLEATEGKTPEEIRAMFNTPANA